MMIKYSLKVWITSVFLGPIIWLSIGSNDFFSDSSLVDFFQFLSVFAIYGAVFSIPALILFSIFNGLITRLNIENTSEKTVITWAALVINYGLFFILFGMGNGDDFYEAIKFSSSYSLSLILGIWYYKTNQDYENHRQVGMD